MPALVFTRRATQAWMRLAPSSSRVARFLMESLASLSVWLPALLTFYALARWADVPFPAHLVVVSAILLALVKGAAPAPKSLDSTHVMHTEPFDLTLLLVVIGILLLPVVASCVDACGGSPRFYKPDEA